MGKRQTQLNELEERLHSNSRGSQMEAVESSVVKIAQFVIRIDRFVPFTT